MGSKSALKEAFEPEQSFGAFYTGGFVSWLPDGSEVICPDQAKLNAVNVDTGKVIQTLGDVEQGFEASGEEKGDTEQEGDVIYSFAVSHDGTKIVSAHRSGLLKLWSKVDGTVLKMWKSIHQGPISRIVFDKTDKLIATGGCDSSVRVWDYENKICMANLKGGQGVTSVLLIQSSKKRVFGASDDNKILVWDYGKREVVAELNEHYAKVTSLSLSEDERYLASTGRDKVIMLWDLETMKTVKIIPVYESIEGGVILPTSCILPNSLPIHPDSVYLAIAGESGLVKIWDMIKGQLLYTQEKSFVSRADEEGGLAVIQLMINASTNQLAVVSADHNILVHNLKTFFCARQLIGFSDEILDLAFVGKKDRFLAVASNSPDIKLYDTTTMNCVILKGHTETVMSLAAHKNLLLSSSKDKSVRLWLVDATEALKVTCVAVGTKHTGSVGSVAMGHTSNSSICASASQDTCLKVWKIPEKIVSGDGEESDPVALQCLVTQVAHEKDINCVAIAPTDKLIATASQDKTAKLWKAEDLSLVATLRGHRRGIWSVRFSPVDQVVLTTSADCTMKLWAMTGECLKSFDCDESSILRGEFISRGTQILSAGSDGLIKLWNIKTSDCATTLDKHEGRIWTLAVASSEVNFYSGGSDSQLIRWKDVTQEKKTETIKVAQEGILQEQELMNLLRQRKMLKALKMALRLEKPLLSLRIVNDLIKSQEGMGLKETIHSLNDLHKEALLKHASNWNTNSRNARAAQLVIEILLEQVLVKDSQPKGLGRTVEELLPYTERHFNRLTEFAKDLQFIEYTLKAMQPHGN